jgi:hypothetical protein
MVMHRNGQSDLGPLTAASDVRQASEMILRIENRMAERLGWKVEDVRPRVARALKTSIGTVANLRRLRRKSIPSYLKEAIVRLLITELQTEIGELAHQLEIHRQVGVDHRDDAFAQAETALAAARKVLERAVGAGRTRG